VDSEGEEPRWHAALSDLRSELVGSMNADFEPFIDSKTAGELLDLHPKTVEKMARDGRLPARKIGKFWRYRASELDAALRSSVNCDGYAYRLEKENGK